MSGTVRVEVSGWVTRFVGGDGSGRRVFDEPLVPPGTVRSVLRHLSDRFPDLDRALWHRDELGEHVEVLVNDAVLGIAHSLESPLRDGDHLGLIGQFMGGTGRGPGRAVPIFHVDAFTASPFAGNPAAVCLLEHEGDSAWMQAVAAEMNLSETAFVVPRPDGFGLRWFTPAVEVDLCGHATLASAHVLWETGALARDAVARFHTLSGVLTAERRDAWIELVFPAEPERQTAAPDGLAAALGVEPRYVGRNRLDYLVEVADEATVRDLRPDLARLGAIETRGVIVTASSSAAGHDFVSRFFAPRVGIAEDPVTGSAHCCLGPFWARRLGKRELLGYQASARGGIVRVREAGERVHLGGQACTVVGGTLRP